MARVTVTDFRINEEVRVESPPLEIHYRGPNQTYVYVGGEQVGLALRLRFDVSHERSVPWISITFHHPDVVEGISEDLKASMWKNIRRIYPLGMQVLLRDADGVDREWYGE